MTTSVLATMCAERLTKLLVRYSRTQPPMVRNQSNCVDQMLSPLPRTEATGAYLKPGASQVTNQRPPTNNKWQPMGSITNIGQRFQREAMDELCSKAKDRLLPKTGPRGPSFTRNQAMFPNKSGGLEDWKQLRTGRYSTAFASIFQGQNCPSMPRKSFTQHSLAFDYQKLYRNCY
ncbi:uncharacterized protein LOC128256904 [Drosophila gunungcola]|uniref:Uncharacterized protein n=1 Tax=Drosophila gunungcola TaxID=103775 RepID=A0A9Q0BKZ9_9MUSC|nr:uncharacterized protein LOC128256904 [Drosophila gunungcola]KAI8035751.1 hypothetical protein M5D96_011501 [Drosophila gunungcola]